MWIKCLTASRRCELLPIEVPKQGNVNGTKDAIRIVARRRLVDRRFLADRSNPNWLVGVECSEVDVSFIRQFGYVLIALGWGIPGIFVVVALLFTLLILGRFAFSKLTQDKTQTFAQSAVVVDPSASARAKITTIVDQHLETLARRRLALAGVDHYGVVRGEAWNKEVQYFADKVVRPALSEVEANAVGMRMNAVFQELIEDRVAKRTDELEAQLNFNAVRTPTDFERWCAKVLENNGWTATVTKASGDQGADVLARKGNQSIVLQCKLYTGTVGNKAVQEAFSAQRHYLTRRSAVVTNAAFTKSAHELARSTRVLLLHCSDLAQLDALIEPLS